MKNDDFDWGDDFLDGDIDFSDDFDSGGSKKGFISGLTSGFLGGLVEHSVGSSSAITRNLKAILPNSYSTLFDKIEYYKIIKDELVQEFKEENYQSVKSLQNIAKLIGEKIDNENSKVKQKLQQFSEDDFASWEKFSYGDQEQTIEYEGENTPTFTEDVNRLLQNQNEAAATTVSGINQMQTEIGGGIIAAVKTGNRGLLGIESGMRDLLNYQRNVQFKMDKTMLDIAAKNYVLDARFYKFSEKANHRIIEELKKISVNSAKSDFAKSNEIERLKFSARNAIAGTIAKRTGGVINALKNQFSSSNRKAAYGMGGDLLGAIEQGLMATDGAGLGKGDAGGILGNWIASQLIQNAPGLLQTGPFRDVVQNVYNRLSPDTRDRISSGVAGIRDFGNAASYASTSGAGLINYYAQYWKDLDTQQFENYEDYADYARQNNLKVLPRSIFKIYNSSIGIAAREKINNYANSTALGSKSKGLQYKLTRRNSENLTQVAQWREINNIALVDVIPGWLSKIYESQERMRTGNDSFKSPVFSYARGQFVDRQVARKIVRSDVFDHNAFNTAVNDAKRIVKDIDEEGTLTDSQINELALSIARNADEEYGFNPFQYVDQIRDVSPENQQAISNLIRSRFGLTDELLQKYNNASAPGRLQLHLTGFKGQYGDRLNSVSSSVERLKDSIPNIAQRIDSNRNAGNEELLRELGLINTKNGVDTVDTNLIWERFKDYLYSGDTSEFQADFSNTKLTDAGLTRGIGKGGRTTTINNANLSGVEAGIETLVETFKTELSKIDFSNIKFDLEGIPDKFDTLNKTAVEQKTLLGKISECVCRSAGGWGNKTSNEKEQINRDENEGKKSLLEKIKAFSPKGFFNRSIEVLAENSPLVLTGLAAGLAGFAFKDPKAAALIAGGVGVGYLYSKLRDLGGGTEPSDDENIYDENGDVLLYASKLRHGDYWDATTKAVLKTWKDIKGAVYDIANKTYVTFSQLTGKLFGPDNRRLIISGLSKARDFAKTVFDKIDISGTFGKIKDIAGNAIYQQDVYVSGDSEPRLTRNGFKNNRYYCLDASTKQPFVISGWNDIEGPVYELDSTDTLTQIISEGEIAQGLVTSSGMKLDSLKEKLSWVKDKASLGLGKLFGYAKEKAGIGADKIKSAVTADYSSIEMRLDRIYYLLCDQFGSPIQPLPNSGPMPEIPEGASAASAKNTEEPLGDAFKSGSSHFNQTVNNSSEFPHKVRLNSFEDKEIKEEKQKRDAFYEDIHEIKNSLEGETDTNDRDKGKKGLFSTILSFAGSAFGAFKKLFTNPLGFMGGLVGMGIKSILKSPLRLIKIGSLLFQGVLGVASPIFKLLRWGLGGILSALGGGVLNGLGDLLPGGKKRKRRRAARDRLRRMNARRTGGGAGGRRSFGRRGIPWLIGGALSFLPFMSRANDDIDSQYREDDYDEGEYDYDDDNYGDEEYAENDYYGNIDNPRDTSAGLIDTGYNTEAALYAGGKVAAGLGGAVNSFAPTAGRLLGGAGKVAGSAASKLFLPLALAQAGFSFADTENIADTFNTNVINGKQRAANAITDFLDLGGLTSGIAKSVGGALGIDTNGLDGAATRLLGNLLDNEIVDKLTDSPLAYAIPGINALKLLGNFQTDLSSIQRKIRIAMYGIKDTTQPLAMILENTERELLKYVTVNQGRVKIADNPVLGELAKKLSQTNAPEAAAWIKGRFLPVYKIWLSVASILGYRSLDAMDKDESPTIVRAVNQAQAAITQFDPYPYLVSPNFSSEYPIMNREMTDARLKELNEELRKKYKERGVDAEGNIEDNIVIRTTQEVMEGKPESDGLFDKATAWLNSKFTKLSLVGFEEPKDVIQIDISDLHPGNGKPMDPLTMVRLGAYGNTESQSVKIDVVLKLERYCEQFFKVQAGIPIFEKEAKEILALFKNSFLLMPSWFENWEKWFMNRFLPVMKTWVREVYRCKKRLPKEGWLSLSSSDKSDVAHALVETKTELKGDATPVWDVEEGPFFNTRSGTDVNAVKKYVDKLDSERAKKLLNDPVGEAAASGAGNRALSPLTDEDRYALYHGGKKANFNNTVDAGLTAYQNRMQGQTGNTILSQRQGGETNYNESILPSYDSGAYEKINSGGDNSYTPTSSTGKSGMQFNISKREAKKVILNEFLKAGYNDPLTLAFAIANAEVETGLNGATENLNYKSETLLKFFKNFRDNPELAYKYGKGNGHPADPRMIARIAYGRGKKAKDLGNRNEDDGERFIGRGFTQLTGRGNYTDIGNAVGEDFVNNPERVGSDPVASVKSTIGFFKTRGVDKALASGNVDRATEIINKYEVEGRQKKIQLTQKYLNDLKSGELKNILDEITAGGSKTPEEIAQEGSAETDASTPSAEPMPGPIEGADGTNKVNIPPADSTDVNAPPITTPDVSVGSPAPVSETVNTQPSSNNTSTDVTKQPQQSVAPTPVTAPTPPVQEKSVSTKDTSSQDLKVTPVYDAAVSGAIDRLTKSLETVLAQTKRVSVTNRN